MSKCLTLSAKKLASPDGWLVGALLILLPACSSAIPHHAAAAEQQRKAEQHAEAQEQTVDEWKQSRSQILRTFAFRALERNLTEESQNYLQQACDLDPTDSQSHATLARLFLTDDDAEASLAYAQQGMESTPGNLDLSLVYAAALAETDQWDRATEELEKATDWEAIARSPELARAMLLHYASSGGMEEAREFVEQMQITHPDNPYTYAMLGDLFLAAGDVRNAAEAYMVALNIDPDLPTPRIITEELNLANDSSLNPLLVAAQVAEDHQDWAGAERLYRFLDQTPDSGMDVQVGLARVLWHQKRLAEAVTILNLLPLQDFTWREHMLVAKIAIGNQDWEKAHASLVIAIQRRPGLKAAELLLTHVKQKMAQ